jgi:chemotaxis receptor (MCP) glutamine deamidase CheD
MAREFFTDAQVEMEIDRLKDDTHVMLARAEMYIQNRRRQYMYKLRSLEKRGKELEKLGYTIDNIEARMMGDDIDGEFAE